MEATSVFNYLSARRYLVDFVTHEQARNPAFSLRKWAKTMGMTSHTLLVLILQGKRSLTLRQVPHFVRGMNLTSQERLYFQALIQYESAETDEERDLCRVWLSEANPGRNSRVREVDEFQIIAHWVHMAILAMTDTRGFKGGAEEIHRRLGKKVSIAEIRSALERLRALGLLKDENGKLVSTCEQVSTRDDVANRGARVYHKQVAALAVEALESQDVSEREFQGFALSIPRHKLSLAKEMIRKFRTRFFREMTTEIGDDVYQMQIQFFRLTECPSEIVPKEDEGTGVSNPKEVH